MSQQQPTPNRSSLSPSTPVLRADLHDSLHRRALLLTRNRPDADDLVQDTFERALRSPMPAELGGKATEGWYFRIMYNRFVDQRRRERCQPFVLGFDLSLHPANDIQDAPPLWRTVSDEELRASIRKLPRIAQQILLMKESGKDSKSIAAELGINKTTVATRLFRARARLRQLASSLCQGADTAQSRAEA